MGSFSHSVFIPYTCVQILSCVLRDFRLVKRMVRCSYLSFCSLLVLDVYHSVFILRPVVKRVIFSTLFFRREGGERTGGGE